MELTNRFKALDMVDRVPEELWTEVCNIVQEAVTKTTLGKKRNKKQGRKEKTYPTEGRAPENRKRDTKAFLNEPCKQIEGNNRMGKISDLLKKPGNIKSTFYAKMGTIKNTNGKNLTEKKD